MRWYVSPCIDELPSPEVGAQQEYLREMVDDLPPKQRHMIERVFFGGASVTAAGAELGLAAVRAKTHYEKGLATLRGLLQSNEEN